jgi:hypothetical protein
MFPHPEDSILAVRAMLRGKGFVSKGITKNGLRYRCALRKECPAIANVLLYDVSDYNGCIPDTATVSCIIYRYEHQQSSHVERGSTWKQRLRPDVCTFIEELVSANIKPKAIYTLVKKQYGHGTPDQLLKWPQTDTVDSKFYRMINRKIRNFIFNYRQTKMTGASSANKPDLRLDQRDEISKLLDEHSPADSKIDIDQRPAYFVQRKDEEPWTITQLSMGEEQVKFFGCLIHPALFARFANSNSDFLGLDQTCGSNVDEIKSEF